MSRPLLIQPPLGFARIGRSPKPVDPYVWGASDDRLEGSATTTIRSMKGHRQVVFFDSDGIRPVDCTFELLEGNGNEELPITPDLVDPKAVTWRIRVGNRKAFYRTGNAHDLVEAEVTLEASSPQRQPVYGFSPEGPQALVPPGSGGIFFGEVEVEPPEARKPYRIRFHPPRGLVYAPTNVAARAPELDADALIQILNPAAAYCNWNPTRDADPRDFVAKLSYFVDEVNIGLMDDTCDGFIRCSAAGRTAVARIAVTPPHLSPGTRHLISVADGLKDREERDDSLYPADHGEADAIALDLLERVFETVQGVNLDAMANLLEKNINPDVAIETSRPWFRNASGLFDPAKYGRDAIERFPLLKAGERRHRRFISLPALKLHLRERPDLLAEILRPPASDEKFFDSKMPAMQRGSDARPLHLTRRQYVFLRMWAKRVAEGA